MNSLTPKSKKLIILILILLVVSVVIFWKNHPNYISYSMVIASLLVYLTVRTNNYKKNNTPDEFFLYNREMPQSQFIPTYVTTNIGLFSSVAFSAILGYYYGVAGMVFTTVAWFAGMYWFSSKIPKILNFLKEGTTIHEFIAISYGENETQRAKLRAWTSGISAILYFASIGVEVKFGANVFAPSLGEAQSIVLALLIAVAGLTLTYVSGYQGVVFTDKIQYYILILAAAVLFIFSIIFGNDNGFSFNSEHFNGYFEFPFIATGPDPFGLLGIVLLLTLYQFCIMDMWQRCIAITKTKDKNNNEISDSELVVLLKKKTFRSAIIPFLILFIVWFTMGVVSVDISRTEDLGLLVPNFLSFFNNYGSWGYFCKAIVETGLVAALISTVDAFLLATVQTIMYDIYGVIRIKKLSEKIDSLDKYQQYRFVDISKVLIVIIGLLSVGLAFLTFSYMNFWTSMYSIMLSFFPAVYFSMNGSADKYSYNAVSTSIIIGSSGALLLGILGTFILNNADVVAAAPFFAFGISFILIKFLK